jgi:membrane protein
MAYKLIRATLGPAFIITRAIKDTIRHDGVEHAGYLSFLAILSFFPSLIFLMTALSFFDGLSIGFLEKILIYLPKEISIGLKPRIDEILSGPSNKYLTIAFIGIIWTASSAVEGLRTILNKAYHIGSPPPYIWRRFLSIVEFFFIIVCIIISTLILVVIPNILQLLPTKMLNAINIDFDFFYLRQIITGLILIVSATLLYYIVPSVKQDLKRTLPGAIVITFLWFFATKLFAYYLNYFGQINLIYGSISNIIISLMYFYFVSFIFIFGASFNYHFAKFYSKRK